MFITIQAGVVLVGFICICWLAFCFVQMVLERWIVTNSIAGMIAGELLCIIATTIFALNSLMSSSNNIDASLAIMLRLVIYLSPAYFTGRLVVHIRKLRAEHIASKAGWAAASEELVKMEQAIHALKQNFRSKNE